MSEKKAQTLVEQQKALTQFLDSLLMEIPDGTSAAAEEAPQVALSDANLEVLTNVTTEERSDNDLSLQQETAVATDAPAADTAGHRVIPEWGREPFKALFFNTGEITLAAPLEKLGGVLTECADITAMPGTSGPYLGVMEHRGDTIRIIDFERFIAETSGEALSEASLVPPNQIILVNEGGIGIACRDVAEVEKITPDEVRWRQGATSRPWYCGIVIEEMCALLDIDALLSILNDSAGK